MSDYIICVNCGKQNVLMPGDPYDVKCEFPGRDGSRHPLRLKIKQEVSEMSNTPDPPLPAREDSPPLYVGKSRTYQPGKRKWAARCRVCEHFYVHDEMNCCDSKRCSQRCPPKLRPHFRPRVEELEPIAPAGGTNPPADETIEAAGETGRTAAAYPAGPAGLPPLPAFDRTWASAVQTEWLRARVTMEELHLKVTSGGDFREGLRRDLCNALAKIAEQDNTARKRSWLAKIFRRGGR